MHFLSRATHIGIKDTKNYTRALQDITKQDALKIKKEEGLDIPEEDRTGFNRQNVQTKMAILLRDIFNPRGPDWSDDFRIISEYTLNTSDEEFHYTVKKNNKEVAKIFYNSKTGFANAKTKNDDKEKGDAKKHEEELKKKITNGMKNIDTFINSAANLESLDLRVFDNRRSTLEISVWGITLEEDEKYKNELSEAYGNAFPKDIYADEENLEITALVEFYDPNPDTRSDEPYPVRFFKEPKGEHENRIERLSGFMKINTLINILERGEEKPFAFAIDKSRNEKELSDNSLKAMEKLLEFAKERGERVTKEDIRDFVATIPEIGKPHGFQNVARRYLKNSSPKANTMK